MQGDRIDALHLAEHLELAPIQLARQVVADAGPAIPLIVGAEHLLRREVQPLAIVRADDQRAVPVPLQRVFARRLARLNVDNLAAPPIVAHQSAVLPLAIDNVGVFRINRRLKAVAPHRAEPFFIGDPRRALRPRRAAERVVVLRPAIDVIKRRAVIDGHAIELRDRQVPLVRPVGGAIEALIDAAVAADEQIVRIVRVDVERVIVNVAILVRHAGERLAPVVRHLHERVKRINPIRVLRVAHQFVVILRAAGVVVAHLRPRLAAIGRAKEAAVFVLRLDDRINDVRVRRAHRHADAALVARRNSAANLPPGLARVGRLVDAGLRPAVHQRPHVPPALIGRGIQHVRVPRIEMNFVHARIVADV